ncbi:hypothetical protein HDU89_000714 [Geranomyces variabilis]|nr:hypothetical protein HDU89_000714 [Geranomyces variabilis]
MLAELRGHLGNIKSLRFLSSVVQDTDKETRLSATKYILLSESSGTRGREDTIIVWRLDALGRQVDSRLPMDLEQLTSCALDGISNHLRSQHGLDDLAIDSVRSGFAKALQEADVKNRVSNVQTLNGKFPSFNSKPVSHDAGKLLFIANGTSTQSRMRPAHQLPQVVLYSLHSQTEICRLKGHTDAIMWAAWSPTDDTVVASASWDQTFRLWDARTGECRAVIGSTGQNWSGAFSPDGTKVLFSGSGGSTQFVRIYDVETAQELVRLPEDSGLNRWMRFFAWSRDGQIAFTHENAVLMWKPFPDSPGTSGIVDINTAQSLTALLRLHADEPIYKLFASVSEIVWVEHVQGSSKLIVKSNESTAFIWDRETNFKWRFQRPKGTLLPFSCTGGSHIFTKTQLLSTMDGDGCVRFWNLQSA